MACEIGRRQKSAELSEWLLESEPGNLYATQKDEIFGLIRIFEALHGCGHGILQYVRVLRNRRRYERFIGHRPAGQPAGFTRYLDVDRFAERHARAQDRVDKVRARCGVIDADSHCRNVFKDVRVGVGPLEHVVP